jgi:hypothetical protein
VAHGQPTSGDSDLLAAFEVRRFHEALQKPPADPFRGLGGVSQIYAGRAWSLAEIAQWPADRRYAFSPPSRAVLRAGLALAAAPVALSPSELGAPAHPVASFSPDEGGAGSGGYAKPEPSAAPSAGPSRLTGIRIKLPPASGGGGGGPVAASSGGAAASSGGGAAASEGGGRRKRARDG